MPGLRTEPTCGHTRGVKVGETCPPTPHAAAGFTAFSSAPLSLFVPPAGDTLRPSASVTGARRLPSATWRERPPSLFGNSRHTPKPTLLSNSSSRHDLSQWAKLDSKGSGNAWAGGGGQ
jgi:hypothetical protein